MEIYAEVVGLPQGASWASNPFGPLEGLMGCEPAEPAGLRVEGG